MRFRPGFDVPFLCVEAVLIGGHYAFPELPYALGLAMFWTGIAGLAAWGLVRLGVLDNIQFFQRWFGLAAPARDVGVGEAIAYVCYRDWGHNFSAAAGSRDVDAVAALHEFRQAASDDRVKIWGKRSRDAVFEPIPAEYWRRHQIEWFGLLRGPVTTEPTVSVADHGNRYEELMTSRTQVEEVWPKRGLHLRFRSEP
jgi:hypothetical protein